MPSLIKLRHPDLRHSDLQNLDIGYPGYWPDRRYAGRPDIFKKNFIPSLIKLRRPDLRHSDFQMERVKGIEPSRSAWKAEVLPLNYTRILEIRYRFAGVPDLFKQALHFHSKYQALRISTP